jgi:hypothetical protein
MPDYTWALVSWGADLYKLLSYNITGHEQQKLDGSCTIMWWCWPHVVQMYSNA